MSGNKAVVDSQLTQRESDLNEIYTEARYLEPLITNELKDMAQKLNTHFTGLEYSVKTASSTEDKLQREEKDFYENPNNIDLEFSDKTTLLSFKDLVRYTEICDHNDIIPTTQKTIQELEAQGYILSGLKNYYLHPYEETAYMGMHLNFITPYGQEIELQVHSEESFDVKQRGHVLYESIRAVSTTEAEKESLKAQVIAIHQSIEKPTDFYKIDNFTMTPKEKQTIIEERKFDTDIFYHTEAVSGYAKDRVSVYSIEHEGEAKFYGFEAIFSDGSAWTYQFDMQRDEKAHFDTITKEGNVVVSYDVKFQELDIDFIKNMIADQEQTHEKWMKENMRGEKELDIKEIKDISVVRSDDLSL